MTNSLLHPSTLEFALPDYANLTDEDYREAALQGMQEQIAALDAVATNPEPATVDNTLVAWERSGETLDRALGAFFVAKAAHSNERRDEIDAELAPLLAAHADAIYLNRNLYHRLIALRESPTPLDEQDEHLLSERIRQFERAGITLDEATQDRLRQINSRLAALCSEFERTLVAGRNAAAILVTDETDLEGLDEPTKAAAYQAAHAASKKGWLIELTNTTGQPILASIVNRELRRRIYLASINRGLGGQFDTRKLIVEITRLRAERARLLGFAHHADYAAADGCAKTSEAVISVVQRLTPGVLERARERAIELEKRLAADGYSGPLEPWDWQFYAAQAASQQLIDHEALRCYFEYSRVLTEGVFAAATALYGITFRCRDDLVGYTQDADVYEVREENGDVLGLVILDPYTRTTKQGGAWMTSIVDQSTLTGAKPVVTATCNFSKPAPGSPSLLTWDDVITLFHEFGHGLHGLLSKVRYPSRSGTNVPRDFVEYPSQVNEIWAWQPDLLARYARHVETGEPLPADVLDALLASRQHDVGYERLELLEAILLDQAWHSSPLERLPTTVEDVAGFEAQALAQAGVAFPAIAPRYRSTYFSHIFTDNYPASYYSYLWSEIMDADTVAWFEAQGMLNREAGQRFRRELLAKGGSVDVQTTYRRFRGKDPEVHYLLHRIGLE